MAESALASDQLPEAEGPPLSMDNLDDDPTTGLAPSPSPNDAVDDDDDDDEDEDLDLSLLTALSNPPIAEPTIELWIVAIHFLCRLGLPSAARKVLAQTSRDTSNSRKRAELSSRTRASIACSEEGGDQAAAAAMTPPCVLWLALTIGSQLVEDAVMEGSVPRIEELRAAGILNLLGERLAEVEAMEDDIIPPVLADACKEVYMNLYMLACLCGPGASELFVGMCLPRVLRASLSHSKVAEQGWYLIRHIQAQVLLKVQGHWPRERLWSTYGPAAADVERWISTARLLRGEMLLGGSSSVAVYIAVLRLSAFLLAPEDFFSHAGAVEMVARLLEGCTGGVKLEQETIQRCFTFARRLCSGPGGYEALVDVWGGGAAGEARMRDLCGAWVESWREGMKKEGEELLEGCLSRLRMPPSKEVARLMRRRFCCGACEPTRQEEHSGDFVLFRFDSAQRSRKFFCSKECFAEHMKAAPSTAKVCNTAYDEWEEAHDKAQKLPIHQAAVVYARAFMLDDHYFDPFEVPPDSFVTPASVRENGNGLPARFVALWERASALKLDVYKDQESPGREGEQENCERQETIDRARSILVDLESLARLATDRSVPQIVPEALAVASDVALARLTAEGSDFGHSARRTSGGASSSRPAPLRLGPRGISRAVQPHRREQRGNQPDAHASVKLKGAACRRVFRSRLLELQGVTVLHHLQEDSKLYNHVVSILNAWMAPDCTWDKPRLWLLRGILYSLLVLLAEKHRCSQCVEAGNHGWFECWSRMEQVADSEEWGLPIVLQWLAKQPNYSSSVQRAFIRRAEASEEVGVPWREELFPSDLRVLWRRIPVGQERKWCAFCGKAKPRSVEGGSTSLKTCHACMQAAYCSQDCQRGHWREHKLVCKRRVQEADSGQSEANQSPPQNTISHPPNRRKHPHHHHILVLEPEAGVTSG